MMYCTLDDLKKQVPEAVLVELTDDEGLGTINTTRVDRAIEDATDLINSYAAARYPTPLNPVPGVIRKIAVDIALYNLFSRRGYDEDSADKSIVDRYKGAITFLEHLAKGMVTIGTGRQPADSSSAFNPGSRLFSRRSMRGW